MGKAKLGIFVAMNRPLIAIIAEEKESSNPSTSKNTEKTVLFVMEEKAAVVDVIFIQKVATNGKATN